MDSSPSDHGSNSSIMTSPRSNEASRSSDSTSSTSSQHSTKLDKLKDWIRREHHSTRTRDRKAIYLYNPRFSPSDLCEALVWARHYCGENIHECLYYKNLISRQYAGKIPLRLFESRVRSCEIDLGNDRATRDFTGMKDAQIRKGDFSFSDVRRAIANIAKASWQMRLHCLEVRTLVGRAQSTDDLTWTGERFDLTAVD